MIKSKKCDQCRKEFSSEAMRKNPNRKFCNHTCMINNRKITDPLHFVNIYHNKIIKYPEGCWSWSGNKDQDGYGLLSFSGKTLKAHRVSWQIHKGKIPPNIFVLHSCDNPICSNPDHLFLGTARDNLIDMIKKGRRVAAKGEKHSRAKLKNENVMEIRSLLKQGYSFGKLGKKFNVDRTAIRNIKNGKSWSHLPKE